MIFSFSRLPTQQIFCLRKKKKLTSQFFSSFDIIKIEFSTFIFFVLPTDPRKSASRRSEKLKINYVWPYGFIFFSPVLGLQFDLILSTDVIKFASDFNICKNLIYNVSYIWNNVFYLYQVIKIM